jgi:hypothetical protein
MSRIVNSYTNYVNNKVITFRQFSTGLKNNHNSQIAKSDDMDNSTSAEVNTK